MPLELTFRTLRGNFALKAVDDRISIDDLKVLLHSRYPDSAAVPPPVKQRLVYQEHVLTQGTLHDASVRDGSSIVLLPNPEPQATNATDDNVVKVPDAATIKKAILEEGRRRGIEAQIREEAPPSRRAIPLGPGELLDLLSMMENRFSDIGGNRMYPFLGQRGTAPGAAAPPSAAPRVAVEPSRQAVPLRVPEPSAEQVEQLTEMGFSDARVRRALLLNRMSTDAAIEWLVAHAEDEDGEEAVPQETLQRLYGTRAGAGRGTAMSAPVSGGGDGVSVSNSASGIGRGSAAHQTLTDMGFDADEAAAALERFRSPEVAITYLLQGPGAVPLGPLAAHTPAGGSDDGASGAERGTGLGGGPVLASVTSTSRNNGPAAMQPTSVEEPPPAPAMAQRGRSPHPGDVVPQPGSGEEEPDDEPEDVDEEGEGVADGDGEEDYLGLDRPLGSLSLSEMGPGSIDALLGILADNGYVSTGDAFSERLPPFPESEGAEDLFLRLMENPVFLQHLLHSADPADPLAPPREDSDGMP